MSEEKDVILLGKPLTEWGSTPWYRYDLPKSLDGIDEHNRRVYRRRYKDGDYAAIGRDIVTRTCNNEFNCTRGIIAKTRFFVKYVLDGLDMTPIIPYIEEGLRFNQEYVELCEKLKPIFNEFEKYGYLGKHTIAERFPLEFWQGAFSNHDMNPEHIPTYD